VYAAIGIDEALRDENDLLVFFAHALPPGVWHFQCKENLRVGQWKFARMSFCFLGET
jgi:hypothetical protein